MSAILIIFRLLSLIQPGFIVIGIFLDLWVFLIFLQLLLFNRLGPKVNICFTLGWFIPNIKMLNRMFHKGGFMKVLQHKSFGLFFIMLLVTHGITTSLCSGNDIIVSPPLYSDSAGKFGHKAAVSVFRIVIPRLDRTGTGFLHKSGKILTAAHVVSDCVPQDVLIRLPGGKDVAISNIISDEDIDVAFLTPSPKISSDSLPVSYKRQFHIGAQVSTWGFPKGYNGVFPMLSVGYLSGTDAVQSKSGLTIERLVVNAAFNAGNSGGPLVEIETGSVIGIVTSKLAPIPPNIETILRAMRENKMGTIWEHTRPDGTVEHFSQDQMLERVIQYLRSQTQLVVGHAVLPEQLNRFIQSNN